ncbi:ribonuclease HII [Thermosynechococcus vestitus]|uniref:Ribonuclease HII n=1 Tax=Thermosynechococcus vestitus (strain NIES-2133 / IAM M-273 / BP-1) TaxID=197221 RepID=RNH2_THEVB|nr:ribonuclease HII [Thermosynechococcus vestitus]Q8DL36.1 RecName: Full=Ribonuclease HII; Short=RNase HII [Thermosynechococcus vestitus BP-1]BAC08214.1 ribonuclease H [Thermosynechococcus vestitus BP-1]BAY51831.1 ribonuclease H [Thermostichus vulcanus NIES-2134]
MEPLSLIYEQAYWQQGYSRVVGVDEVGRGCLAGPVVAAAVILPVDCVPLPEVRDSKQLTARQRSRLFAQIYHQAIAIGIGSASVAEIDQVNILQATYRAMARALGRVAPWDHALIDGKLTKTAPFERVTAIIGGDRHSYSIACASIIAKVRRDRFMARLARRYPQYGWERNVGYGTPEHRQALDQYGLTPWHRRSFLKSLLPSEAHLCNAIPAE